MIIYTIKKGDTLYQIAKKYQVPLQSIISINQLTDINNLVIGQTILIPTLPIIEVNGYCYPNINRNVFQKTLPFLTYVSIFSYQVNVDGTLTILNDEELISNALRENVAPMLIITNINKEGSFDSNLAHEILVNRNVQSNLINNLLDIMKTKNYYGLGIDFEYILPKDRANYNYFLSKVVEVMHANHYIVTTALAPKTRYDQPGTLYEAHDYYAHGKYADHVILMTYEWGYTYGPPMAVSPIDQVEKVLQYAITVIDSKKILMGIPNYGYDWILPYQKGIPAKSISNIDAIKLAQTTGSEILFDTTAMSPYFFYNDVSGNRHVVWFEDARSISAKLNLVKKYNLGGISYWTIMNYFSQGLELLNHQFNIKKVNRQ